MTSLSEDHIRDLCADFAPGVRLTNGSIGVAGEEDVSFALAATARWEDSRVVERDALLQQFVLLNGS